MDNYVFAYIFILILIMCITSIVMTDNQNYNDHKQQIINKCEQMFVGNYGKIKDCIDFELNYKL